MRTLAAVILFLALPGRLWAGSYVQQDSFALPLTSIAAMDSDAVGNLYLLGLPAGATSWQISGYKTPQMSPLFSFDTGISSPLAFAVEGTGVVDVLDNRDGLLLRRFTNTGVFLSQSSYPVTGYNFYSTAIDKANGLLYVAYQYTYHPLYPMCLGCGGPSTVTMAVINQYDLQGRLLRATPMPGASSTPSTTCYRPSKLAVDGQGSLYVADAWCQQLLKFSADGTLTAQTTPQGWSYAYLDPQAMWADPQANLYVSMPFCDGTGCHGSILKLDGSANTVAQLRLDSAVGSAWDSRILYLAAGGAPPVRRYVFNGPPGVPAQSSPLGSVVQHSSAAALAWQSSSDPDSDQVIYTVSMGTVPTQLSPLGGDMQNSLATPPLVFGGTYYWQVTATDFYMGLAVQTTPSPVMSFNLNMVNSPPGTFAVAGGTGTAATRATSADLSWQAAVDPDGDPVVYDVLWRSATQSTPTIAATTPGTSWQMTGLAFGATYYWSAKARDVYGAVRPLAGGAEQSYCPVFRNSAPPASAALSGMGVSAQHTLTPEVSLAWSPVEDSDGDPVTYRLYAGTSPASMVLLQDSPGLSYDFTAPFNGTTYYWQVRACDAYGGASTGPVQALHLVLSNRKPDAVEYLSQANLQTRAKSHLLTWAKAEDPDGDPVSYRFEAGGSSLALITVQVGTETACALPLAYGTTIYYRVTAMDPFGAAAVGQVRSLFAEFLNDPPQPPDMVAPFKSAPVVKTMNNSVTVSWEQVTNPQGDPITYTIYFGDSAGNMSPLASIEQAGLSSLALRPLQPRPQAEVRTEGNSVVLSLTDLDYYKSYYLRVAASNPYGAASTTGVQRFSLASADGFPAAYNYPNPFNPNRGGTNIVFNAPASGYGRATVEVFSEWRDLLFKRDYFNIPPGISQVSFDGRDRGGKAFFNGSYVCRVRFSDPDAEQIFHMAVVK
jgi:hypothetical protein